jgi:hypothetical protein
MLAKIIAPELIYAIPIILLALWIWSEPGKRAGLFSFAIASVFALGANQSVGLI